jgi:hypothetical protein
MARLPWTTRCGCARVVQEDCKRRARCWPDDLRGHPTTRADFFRVSPKNAGSFGGEGVTDHLIGPHRNFCQLLERGTWRNLRTIFRMARFVRQSTRHHSCA